MGACKFNEQKTEGKVYNFMAILCVWEFTEEGKLKEVVGTGAYIPF